MMSQKNEIDLADMGSHRFRYVMSSFRRASMYLRRYNNFIEEYVTVEVYLDHFKITFGLSFLFW